MDMQAIARHAAALAATLQAANQANPAVAARLQLNQQQHQARVAAAIAAARAAAAAPPPQPAADREQAGDEDIAEV